MTDYNNKKVKVYNDGKAYPLYKATGYSCGFDLSSNVNITIPANSQKLVSTGIKLEMDVDVAAFVVPRSGMAIKHGITVLNSPGLIDSDYKNDIGVILHNTSNTDFDVFEGDRIAQLVFINPILENNILMDFNVGDKERGLGGFGSSGTS